MKEISLNFGAIKESVLRYSANQFLNEDKETVSGFAEEIQNNEILKKQYLIYKIFENAKPFTKDHLAERFINQSFRLFEGLDWKDILKTNEYVRVKFLGESHVSSTSGKDELFNSINTLIESRCHAINPTEDQEAYEVVLNYIMRPALEEVIEPEQVNESTENPKIGSWKFVTSLAVNNFNKRYEHLNEGDRSLLKVLLSPSNHKTNYLEDLKLENIALIEKLIESGSEELEVAALGNFRQKLDKIDSQDIAQIDEAIISCFELKEILSK